MLEAVVPAAISRWCAWGESTSLEGRLRRHGARGASATNALRWMNSSPPPANAADRSCWSFRLGARQTSRSAYTASPAISSAGRHHARETNRLAAIAPSITNLPQAIGLSRRQRRRPSRSLPPALRPGQTVSLLIGQVEVGPEALSRPPPLDFIVEDADPGAPLPNAHRRHREPRGRPHHRRPPSSTTASPSNAPRPRALDWTANWHLLVAEFCSRLRAYWVRARWPRPSNEVDSAAQCLPGRRPSTPGDAVRTQRLERRALAGRRRK